IGMGAFPEEAGLADTRLPDHSHHLAVAGTGLLPGPAQGLDLSLSSDEGGKPTGGGGLEAFACGASAHEVADLKWGREPLERHRPRGSDRDEPLHQPQSVGREQDAPRGGELLHAGCQMRGLTDRRVVHMQIVTNGAHDHLTTIETDTRLDYHAVAA